MTFKKTYRIFKYSWCLFARSRDWLSEFGSQSTILKVLFKNRKEIAQLKDKVDKLEYEKAFANTLYQIDGSLIYGSQFISWAQNQTSTFTVPTDPYVIYKTCAPIGSAIRKITNWISKYSWNLDLENVSERESFTSIIRKTVRSLLGFGNTYWDISNGLIYVLPTNRIKVIWDDATKTSNKLPVFEGLTGSKKYYILDKKGIWQPLDTDNVVHFILDVDCLEIKGSSIISSMQNEINTYYYQNDSSDKKYNRNEIPKMIANFKGGDPAQLMDFKRKVVNTENPNEPLALNAEQMDIYEPNKIENFGDDYIAFMEFFGKLVYFVFGMSETDKGEISATKASAEIHHLQTQSTLIEPILDIIAEEWNLSNLKSIYGEFEWRAPEIEADINEESDESDESARLKLVEKESKDATSV